MGRHLDDVYDFFVKNKLLSYSSLYNVNIPKDGKEILFTRQGGRYYNDKFEKTGEETYRQRGYSAPLVETEIVDQDKKDFFIDTDAALNGYISVTPITLDRTDYDVLEKLSGRRK